MLWIIYQLGLKCV